MQSQDLATYRNNSVDEAHTQSLLSIIQARQKPHFSGFPGTNLHEQSILLQMLRCTFSYLVLPHWDRLLGLGSRLQWLGGDLARWKQSFRTDFSKGKTETRAANTDRINRWLQNLGRTHSPALPILRIKSCGGVCLPYETSNWPQIQHQSSRPE